MRLLLLLAAGPGTIRLSLGAPAVGPELSLGPRAYTGAAYAQMTANAAFNGTNLFVAWRDNRDGQSVRAFGTRLTPEGTVLDPDNLPLVPGDTRDVTEVAVAPFDSGFLVFREYNPSRTEVSRVWDTGQVDPTNLWVLPGSVSPQPMALNGTNSLVVWTANAHIFGSRLNAQGTLLDPGGIALCTNTNGQSEPVVAPLGTNWLVAWTDLRREHNGYGTDGDIFGTLVAPDGSVLFPDGFPICTTNQAQTGPRMASLGDTCLVAWTDARNSSFNNHSAAFAARINALGQVLDDQGFVVDNSRQYQPLGGVATDGTNWVVVHNESIDGYSCYTMAVTVSPQGVPVYSSRLEYTLNQYSHPVVVFGCTNYVALWESRRGDSSYMLDVIGTRLSGAGAMLDPVPFTVSLAASSQVNPVAAGDGTNYLLVWSDNRRGDGRWDIFGTRITAQGALADPGGIPITWLDGAQTNPAVACGGAQYLVAWVDTRGGYYPGYQSLYAARVSADGTLLDTNGFLVSAPTTYNTRVAVGSLGTNYLVLWDGQTDTYNSRLSAVRVAGDGTVLDAAPLVLFGGAGGPSQPKVTSDGTNYLVLFSANYSGQLLLSPTGAILQSNYQNYLGGSHLVSNGSGFLASSDSPYGISLLFFDPAGAFVRSVNFAPTFYNSEGYLQTVAGNGRDYLLAYNPTHLNSPVYLSQVTSLGRMVHTNLAFTDSSVLKEMALAGADHNYLLAYSKMNASSVPRLSARILDDAPVLDSPKLASGQVTLSLDGPAERIYEVQSSTDLQHWAAAGSQSNQLGTLQFTVPSLGPKAFYRARRVD